MSTTMNASESNTGPREAWQRILDVRLATEKNLKELQWTLAYCFLRGDQRLFSDLTPAAAALGKAVRELDDYLAVIGKSPVGKGKGSDVSTGTTDVPERDSGSGDGDGGGDDGGGTGLSGGI